MGIDLIQFMLVYAEITISSFTANVTMTPESSPLNRLPTPPIWRHLLAMLYDLLLILPLFMAATAIWVAILGPTDTIAEPSVPAALQWAGWLLIVILFFGIFWRRGGQTLGMQAWRIKLVTEQWRAANLEASADPCDRRLAIGDAIRSRLCLAPRLDGKGILA